MKRILSILLLLLVTVSLFNCRKEPSYIGAPDPDPTGPDLATKVTASVSGFVIDENNVAVQGAAVNFGAVNTTTDQFGYFEVKNADVVKNAAVVTVIKAGYFKGIKTFIAASNKAAFFRIKLIPKTNTGSISATTGGEASLSNGLIVNLPANAVVVASTNAVYNGNVLVSSFWIDPTGNDLNQLMPGDLRGIDEAGALKALTTYGMAAVELTGAAGELLQIADGKKATLTMPLPSAIASSAPSSIPLWSFDETNGLWKREGTAVKTGNTYSGEVSHFSFWNCDVPNDYVQFNCTVVDNSGIPIPYVAVKISVASDPSNARVGYTDSSGYVAGAIPPNSSLVLEVFSYSDCGITIHSQNFNSSTTDVSLGNISVNTTNLTAHVTGSVTDCANAAVINGNIIVSYNNVYFRYPLSNNGTFDFTTLICNVGSTVNLIAQDNTASQQSTPLNYSLVAGTNVVGNLQACGTSTAEFITYSYDGGITFKTFTMPPDTVYDGGDPASTFSYITGNDLVSNIGFGLDMGIIPSGNNTIFLSGSFYCSDLPQFVTVPQPNDCVGQFTEYGPVGGYMAGNFTVTVIGNTTPVPYPFVVSFRVRRVF